MITGQVTAFREATLDLKVLDANDLHMHIDAVVDTGFTGTLTLSPSLVDDLALPYVETTTALLADGTSIQARTYSGVVLWDGIRRRIKVYAAEGGALIGMSLMYGYRLSMDIIDGGSLTLEPLA